MPQYMKYTKQMKNIPKSIYSYNKTKNIKNGEHKPLKSGGIKFKGIAKKNLNNFTSNVS